MNNIDRVRDILIQATSYRNYDVEELAKIALDIISGDRLIIKVLGRNIENLTMQMKEITQVTFERDAFEKGMEVQKDIMANMREKIEAYKDAIGSYQSEIDKLKERLAKYE